MNAVAAYTLALIVSTAVSVTAAILIIRKVIAWRATGSNLRLVEFFTERLSYILAFYDKESIDAVRTSFISMMKRSKKIGRFSRRKKRETARRVMLNTAQEIVGENRDFLVRLYDELGFADDAVEELGDRRWWKRADAIRELRIMRVSRAAKAISKLLSDRNDEARLLAFESTIELEGIGSLPVLAGMLRKMTPWSSISMARIISEHKNESGPHVLPLLRHTDISVRLFAIRILGVLKSIEAVPSLITIAESGKTAEAREALLALGRIGDERAVEPCYSSLSNPDAGVRIAAATALGAYGAPQVVGNLLPLLEDVVSDVRLASAQALSKCGAEGSSALETAFLTGSLKASKAARHALDDIELSSVTPIVIGDY